MNTSFFVLSIELSIPSELGFEKVAREALATFARRFGFDAARIEDLKTAIGEACINAIEHGNQQLPGLRVNVSCQCDDQRLTVEIIDQGIKRYQSCGAPNEIASKLCGAAPFRGMGLMLIAQLTDEAGFAEDSGNGNRFRFAVNRAHRAKSSDVAAVAQR